MIKHIMVAALSWLTMIAAVPSYAQQQETPTLGDLWPTVASNYPGIAAKTAAIDAARFNERAVKSDMLPQVNAQAQNTYGTYEGNAGAFFPQPGFFNVSGAANPLAGSKTVGNSFASATVEWELFSFGKLRKEHEAADVLLRKTVSEKDAYLLNLKKTLAERYISLLYNDAKLHWTAKNAARLDSIRHITAGLSAAGLKPAADSLLAAYSYVQAMGQYDKWDGLTNASLIKLLELYGGNHLNYTESAKRFNSPEITYGGKKNTLNPSHPVLQALDAQSGYYRLRGEAQKRAGLPSVRLLGGYAYRGTGIGLDGTASGAWKDGFGNPATNGLMGIGIVWNITNLATKRLKGAQLFNINPTYEISVPAELKPYEQVAVYAKVTGFVKQLRVDRGDHVRKGQLLAVLEAPEMEQQYLADKSTEQ